MEAPECNKYKADCRSSHDIRPHSSDVRMEWSALVAYYSGQACFSDVPVYCGRKFSLYKQSEKVPWAAAACQLGDDLPDNSFIPACAKS